MKKFIYFFLIFSIFSNSLFGINYEKVIWDYNPIKVELIVGIERRIDFPNNIQDIKIKQKISGSLKSLDIDNRVFWLAKKQFSQSRILVMDTKNHQFIFDVSAVKSKDTKKPEPLLVLIKKEKEEVKLVKVVKKETASPFVEDSLGYIGLTRFAAKEVYAPERLRKKMININRVPLNTGLLFNLIDGISENGIPLNIKAKPLASWRNGNLFITAVKLNNLSKSNIILDPRYLKGKWLSATFQHHKLFSMGDGADNTVVYLISKRHFGESL